MRSRYTCWSCILQQSRELSLPLPSLLAPVQSPSSFTRVSPQWKAYDETLRSRRGVRHASTTPTPARFSSEAKGKRVSRKRRDYSSESAAGNATPKLEDRAVLSRVKPNLNFHVNSAPVAARYGKEHMTIAQAMSISRDSELQLPHSETAEHHRIADAIAERFAGQGVAEVAPKLIELLKWCNQSSHAERLDRIEKDPSITDLLHALDIIQSPGLSQSAGLTTHKNQSHDPSDSPVRFRRTSNSDPAQSHIESSLQSCSPIEDGPEVPPTTCKTLNHAIQPLQSVNTGVVNVPRLSFDLSRVLFNPGVYRLQDPRSRVYNFDPYLEKIMPVTEFNFEALNKYVTSSEDDTLRSLAVQRQKRYVGSSSSMTGTLAHFHYLLSSWRTLDLSTLSRGFKAETDNYTKFQRAPTAIFLRYQNGVYAMDADKEFDDATILMSLGRSMEKLLTLEKSDYERLRKSNAIQSGDFDLSPEQYHYSELGTFLMRSQLDAYDPRLPGTGMFDLKTRAVVSVRMTRADQRGSGYEIKHRYGTFESFEREYYDMMRAAFLKYSLQVRMGRMDGIFVAFHNIERIFGFQYISLAEMDRALHGQTDRRLGDQEFRFSIELLTEVFDRATKEFPNQSLRFHFEARESLAAKKEAKPWMYVFAEPVSEEEIDKIQRSRQEEVKQAEERILKGEASINQPFPEFRPESNAGDTDFLENLDNLRLDTSPSSPPSSPPSSSSSASSSLIRPRGPILGLKIVVQSRINGEKVVRPVNITADQDQKWELDYSIMELTKQQAELRYTQCRTRRHAMFAPARESDMAFEGYVSRLLKMSEEGKEWRRQRDALDAQKKKIVLYDDDRIE